MRCCATSSNLVAGIDTDGKLTVWQVWDTDRENLARGVDAGFILQTLNASIDEYSACNWTCCAMSGDLLVAGNDGTTQRVTPERPGRSGAASLVVWNLKTGNKEQIVRTTIPISCCAIHTHPPARFSNTDNTLLRDRSLIVVGSGKDLCLYRGTKETNSGSMTFTWSTDPESVEKWPKNREKSPIWSLPPPPPPPPPSSSSSDSVSDPDPASESVSGSDSDPGTEKSDLDITCCAIAGNTIAYGKAEHLFVCDTTERTTVRTFYHAGRVTCCAVSMKPTIADVPLIAAGDEAGDLVVWGLTTSLQTDSAYHRFRHGGKLTCCAISDDPHCDQLVAGDAADRSNIIVKLSRQKNEIIKAEVVFKPGSGVNAAEAQEIAAAIEPRTAGLDHLLTLTPDGGATEYPIMCASAHKSTQPPSVAPSVSPAVAGAEPMITVELEGDLASLTGPEQVALKERLLDKLETKKSSTAVFVRRSSAPMLTVRGLQNGEVRYSFKHTDDIKCCAISGSPPDRGIEAAQSIWPSLIAATDAQGLTVRTGTMIPFELPGLPETIKNRYCLEYPRGTILLRQSSPDTPRGKYRKHITGTLFKVFAQLNAGSVTTALTKAGRVTMAVLERELPAELVGMLDRDGDGVVTMADLMSHLDTDKDGEITYFEFSQGIERLLAEHDATAAKLPAAASDTEQAESEHGIDMPKVVITPPHNVEDGLDIAAPSVPKSQFSPATPPGNAKPEVSESTPFNVILNILENIATSVSKNTVAPPSVPETPARNAKPEVSELSPVKDKVIYFDHLITTSPPSAPETLARNAKPEVSELSPVKDKVIYCRR